MEITQEIFERWNTGDLGEDKIRLWWVTPLFKNLKKICRNLDDSLFYLSDDESYILIWLRPSWFGIKDFSWPQLTKWIPRASLVSGSGKNIQIGVMLSRHFSEKDKFVWNENKTIWSIDSGSKSSETCKWILGRIADGVVVDPYAQSQHVASWCRRYNLGYRGYADNQEVRTNIEKELAQVEIPGIQEELPL